MHMHMHMHMHVHVHVHAHVVRVQVSVHVHVHVACVRMCKPISFVVSPHCVWNNITARGWGKS